MPGILNISDKAYVETMWKYKVENQPYVLEISLRRNIEDEKESHCQLSMYSNTWDNMMGRRVGEAISDWEENMNLEALFPPNHAGNKVDHGFHQFLVVVEELRSLLAQAV